MKKVKTSVIIVIVLMVMAFATSLVTALMSNNGKRYTFVFPSGDSDSFIIENRYLPLKSENIISRYVDELLLGPISERTKLIFPRGTKVLSCFQRGGMLYLDLSKDLLAVDPSSYPLKSGAELLEKNITTNFASIKKVEIYVDSKRAWE
ncbi:MAG: GerMN domain-containing protein [Treponema sp.]|nr:GerMN domain-containing protein [Treponema sp.]